MTNYNILKNCLNEYGAVNVTGEETTDVVGQLIDEGYNLKLNEGIHNLSVLIDQ